MPEIADQVLREMGQSPARASTRTTPLRLSPTLSGASFSMSANSDVREITLACFDAEKDDSSILATLAHEYGHAIEAESPGDKSRQVFFRRVTECLESKKSAGATKEQASEAFADWFAAEILAKKISQMTTATVDQKLLAAKGGIISCDNDYNRYQGGFFRPDLDPHLNTEIRANSIVMAHPYFRELFGCEPKEAPAYCP